MDLPLSRRRFLAGLAVMAAGPVGQQSPAAWLEEARSLLQRDPSFDLHTHPGLFPMREIPNSSNPRPYRGDEAVSERVIRMVEVSLWGGFFTMVLDAPILGGPRGQVREFEPGEGWAEYKRQLAVLGELIADLPVMKATSAEDIRMAHQRGRVAAIFACEGGDFLEGNAGHLEEAYADGVRHVQLVHVARNDLAEVDENGRDAGLTAAGRDVVREMNRLGMVIDLGHASYATTKAVADITSAPIISSHSLVRREGGRGGLSREHVEAIVGTGGLIGAFGGASSRDIAGYVDNILYMVEVAGVDHVGLGSDMDGTNAGDVFNHYGKLPEIAAGLLASGMSPEEVAKVMGGNAVRVLEAVVG